jgi:hypothetical protein
MLTKEIISGFNLLSLAGFVVMALTLGFTLTEPLRCPAPGAPAAGEIAPNLDETALVTVEDTIANLDRVRR